MKTRLAIAATAALLATAIYFMTRGAGAEPPPPPVAAGESPADSQELAGSAAEVSAPVPEPARRATIPRQSPVPESNRLRVVLEGIPDDEARRAKITLTGVDDRKERWPKDIRESWQYAGPTNEFDLDPFLERVAQQQDLRIDQLEVEVDHPDHLLGTGRVPLSEGVTTNGTAVHEVRIRLVEPDYWPEFSLSVLDANTRAHIEDIELRSGPSDGMAMWGYNGWHGFLADGLSSPIALMGGRNADDPNAWVEHMGLRPARNEPPRLVKLVHSMRPGFGVIVTARAPGYTADSIVLDLTKHEDRELLLTPGSTIDVKLTNVQLDRYRALGTKPMLCVYWIRPDRGNQYVHFAPIDETLRTEGFRLEHLRPGGYRVMVELGGGSWTERPVLAREELAGDRALVADETRTIELTLDDPPASPKRATLHGTVALPDFESAEDVRLQLYFQPTQRWRKPDVEFSLADLRRTPGPLPSWSFRAEDLPVGMYRVQLLPFLNVWMVELPAEGRELELALPDLAEVIVETVDGKTGEPVPLDELHYRRKHKLPHQEQHDRAQAETLEPGRFRFWSTPGVVAMWPRGQGSLGFARGGRDVELVAGRQTVRFELAHACLIHFDLRVDGTEQPRLSDAVWDWVHYETLGCVRAVDHDGRSMGRSGKQITEVSKPGVYEIHFDGLTEGVFHPVPSRLVSVRAGETTEVVVELRRL